MAPLICLYFTVNIAIVLLISRISTTTVLVVPTRETVVHAVHVVQVKCVSVCAGLHPVLQAEYFQVYSAPLGPNARLLYRLRHSHTEDVQVGLCCFRVT